MNKLSKLTKKEIITGINAAETLVDVCRKLDINDSGGNKRTLRKFIADNNIDTSHFKRNLTEEQYKQNPKLCKNCGKVIDWEHHENEFCSRSCATIFNNKLRDKSKEVRVCVNCGKLLIGAQRLYCCQTCQQEYQNNEYLSRWKSRLETGLSGEYGLSKRIRRYLLDKVNYKCELCGWGETNLFTNTIPLEIHHKDGDYTNNKEENLQVLCPNCHSLTETFKSHNKDGRKGRSRYYNNEQID